MIVSREYIPFRTLIDQHDKGGELFIKLCKKSYPRNMWERAYLQLADYSLYQREMEWGFLKMGELIEGFQLLDQTEPYETGYTLNDVCTADVIKRDSTTLTLLLRTGDNKRNSIVGILTVPVSSEKYAALK